MNFLDMTKGPINWLALWSNYYLCNTNLLWLEMAKRANNSWLALCQTKTSHNPLFGPLVCSTSLANCVSISDNAFLNTNLAPSKNYKTCFYYMDEKITRLQLGFEIEMQLCILMLNYQEQITVFITSGLVGSLQWPVSYVFIN